MNIKFMTRKGEQIVHIEMPDRRGCNMTLNQAAEFVNLFIQEALTSPSQPEWNKENVMKWIEENM